MAYGDEGTVVAAPVAVAGDVVTVVEAVEAEGHKIDLTDRSSLPKTLELAHGLGTPNDSINQRNLNFWVDVVDKICFGRT